MYKLVVRTIFSGVWNANPMFRNRLNNTSTKFNSSPSKPQNPPSSTTCDCGCSGADLHPLYSVQHPKYKDVKSSTQQNSNPKIPNLQNPKTQNAAASAVLKNKPKIRSRKMFPHGLIIYRNPPSKESFKGWIGFLASCATLGSLGWVWVDQKNKKKQEEKEDAFWENVELRMNVILDWSIKVSADCEKRCNWLLNWIMVQAMFNNMEVAGAALGGAKADVDDGGAEVAKGADVGTNVEAGGKDVVGADVEAKVDVDGEVEGEGEVGNGGEVGGGK